MKSALKMYCEVSISSGTDAAAYWPDEFSGGDIVSSDSTDINGDASSDGNSNIVDGDANVLSEDTNVPNADISTPDFTKKNSKNTGTRASGSCPSSMPHLYMLKDTSCCNDPSQPQCSSVEGKKLGCLEKTGKCNIAKI